MVKISAATFGILSDCCWRRISESLLDYIVFFDCILMKN